MDTSVNVKTFYSVIPIPVLMIILSTLIHFGCAGKQITGVIEEEPLKALDSFDPKIREMAARSLGEILPVKNKHITSQLKRIHGGDYNDRIESINSIAESGVNMTGVVDALCTSLTDADPGVRAASAESLGMINRELASAIYPLESVLENSQSEDGNQDDLLYSAKRAYVVIRPLAVKIETALTEQINDSDEDVHEAVADAVLGIETGKSQVFDASDKTVASISNTPATESVGQVKSAEGGNQNAVSVDVESIEQEPSKEYTAKTIEEMISDLDSFDDEIRRQAAISIGLYYYEREVELEGYIRILKNGDVSNRIDAADAIAEIGGDVEMAVDTLCLAMEDINEEVRIASSFSLGSIIGALSVTLKPLEDSNAELHDVFRSNDQVNQDGMMQLYMDSFRESYKKAVSTVQSIQNKGIPVLVSRLDDESYNVRQSVAEALKEITPSTATDPAFASARDGNGGAKLAGRDSDTASEVNMDASNKEDAKENSIELQVLLLITELGNSNVSVARKAANKLGEMGPDARDAVPALIRAVENESNWHAHYKYVRRDAITALGKIGPDAGMAEPALISKLNHLNYEIRTEAAVALGRISTGSKESLKSLIRSFEEDESALVREAALSALGECDPGPMLDKCYLILFKALKDANGNVRLNAFKVIAKYEAKNKGKGLIKWKALKGKIDGYRVCVRSEEENYMECIDTGEMTAMSPVKFQKFYRDRFAIDVKGRKGQLLYDVKWTHVNIRSILSRAVELEKDPAIKKEKGKALELLVKSLQEEGALHSGLAQLTDN